MTALKAVVPLVLGLAADDAPAEACEGYIRAALSEIVTELRAAHPHTPLLALCTLASAGELVAARTALALGIPIACLAPPAGDRISAPPADLLDACQDRWSPDPSFEARYAPFGAEAHVAHYSDLVVAFGAPPQDGSRLAAVVTLRDRGRFPGRRARGRILDPPDVGPYRRVVPGPDQTYTMARFFPARYTGDATSERDAAFALRRLDEFNADVRAGAPDDDSLLSESLERAADTYANDLQAHVVFWQRFLYWAAFVAATAQFILPKTRVAALIDIGTVAVAFAAYLIAQPAKYQGRYQDYRALSEGLRVQSAWSRAGVAESVAEAYLRMQQTELQWIRSVLRTVALLQRRRAVADPARDREAVAAWVNGQRTYFRNASLREARREGTFTRWAALLTPINAILGVTIFAFVAITGINPVVPGLSTPDNRYTLEILVGTFAGWAALSATALHSYARTRGFSENANRYERMYLMFDEASLWLSGEAGRPLVEARELAAELGREALAEQAEWLLAQRERPIRVVHVGA